MGTRLGDHILGGQTGYNSNQEDGKIFGDVKRIGREKSGGLVREDNSLGVMCDLGVVALTKGKQARGR